MKIFERLRQLNRMSFFNKNLGKSQRYTGFTLAEVLITLGIIGVVAALTIPNLVMSYQKQVVISKLKKFYTISLQAIEMSKLDNGDVSSWDFGTLYSATDTLTWFNKYLAPYIKTCNAKIDPTNNAGIIVYFADGTMARYQHNGGVDIGFYTDNNANSNTHTLGKDCFMFVFYQTDDRPFRPYESGLNTSSRDNYRTQTLGCSLTKAKYYCTALIIADGWQIKSDYPYFN